MILARFHCVKIAGRKEQEVALDEKYAEDGDLLVESSHASLVWMGDAMGIFYARFTHSLLMLH